MEVDVLTLFVLSGLHSKILYSFWKLQPLHRETHERDPITLPTEWVIMGMFVRSQERKITYVWMLANFILV